MSSGIESNDTISVFDGLSIASDITKSKGTTHLTLFRRAWLIILLEISVNSFLLNIFVMVYSEQKLSGI